MSNADPDPNAPRKVTVDNQTVEGHSLTEQMAAADRAAAKANVATNKKRFGLRAQKMNPGGAV